MTATATLCTSFGFAMAADGRRSFDHDFTTQHGESDSVQKIFEISRKDAAFAYCIRGETINEQMTWDIAAELWKTIESLKTKRFLNGVRFVKAICSDLQERIGVAKSRGHLERFPTSQITFAGYFHRVPCWIDASFHFSRLGFIYQLEEYNCTPGRNFCSGSDILARLIRQGDERVFDFFAELNDEKQSLDTAAFMAGKYIELCCSPLIRGLEPDECKTVGGHIHVATVTPLRWRWFKPNTGGFRWEIEPLNS
jgi:hypothetical protein